MSRSHPFISVVLTIIVLLAAGCRSEQTDPRLDRAALLASDNPSDALSCLDSIDPDGLSEADRHLYDFLTVKARDKAYITHTSDSLILGVIAYTENHRVDASHRAEALYYGGRVYSDLGDYPTALEYFQEALDVAPDDASTLTLRGVILSQTGQLMRKIGLYAESIPYTEQSLELRRLASDTRGEYYALRALGYTYYKLKRYPEAEQFYKKAYDISQKLSREDRAIIKINLAEIYLRMDRLVTALSLIRSTLDSVAPISRNEILGPAINIYYKAGIRDSAFMYAKEIVNSKESLNKHMGYSILLAPEMRGYTPIDTLFTYLGEYRELMNEVIDNNGSDMFINRFNYYDYQKHVRENSIAEERVDSLTHYIWVLSSISGVLFIGIVVLISIMVIKRKGVRVSTLNSRANEIIQNNICREELLKTLIEKLEEYEDVKEEEIEIKSDFVSTNAFKELNLLIQEGKTLPPTSSLWKEIEKTVLSSSPKFIENLQLLTNGKLTEAEKQMALLVRMGVETPGIIQLLSRTKGAIGSRKSTLSQKMLDRKLSPFEFTIVILNL